VPSRLIPRAPRRDKKRPTSAKQGGDLPISISKTLQREPLKRCSLTSQSFGVPPLPLNLSLCPRCRPRFFSPLFSSPFLVCRKRARPPAKESDLRLVYTLGAVNVVVVYRQYFLTEIAPRVEGDLFKVSRLLVRYHLSVNPFAHEVRVCITFLFSHDIKTPRLTISKSVLPSTNT